ncbi:DUF805 domain-containing protein [uncultured Ferrimonas sp.]|uniref:DUF805 domain-containing protein n=1 Tax=uncultured Ferrimonas sp. TaxID=432640 RepID=UPI0026104256|nr:DUF805 domain-containing protein [uncultured Ferrimonas sp.]
MNQFIDGFKKFADFSSRARRKDYWMFYLFYFITYVVLALVDMMLGSIILTSVFALLTLIPGISLGVRRLHDTGRSGWWMLLFLVPLIGALVLLVFFCFDSQGDNEYGPNPKAATAA